MSQNMDNLARYDTNDTLEQVREHLQKGVNLRALPAYIDPLKQAGVREVDTVWYLWIKSIYIALR